ncbi:MAG: M13 family metallopeptidase [Bacteroidota bacterium]|nr:M13 family metallopeptidase [Bacteroidota bacterium]MDP3146220.1 M13 family metallopeptidase [Bacteroidota bacterium]MDP3556627.1 M13 family metallopeptidase [Bacteroidota bacterium]
MKKTILSLILFSSLNFLSQKAGINFSYIDSSVTPQNDFYTFCNGNWQKKFILPESDARYGSFNEINNNNLKNIKIILDNASKNKTAAPNSNAQKLRDFYNTAMDSVKADKLGYSPIKEQLEKIEKIKTVNDLIILKSKFDFDGVSLFFVDGVSPDAKNSKKNSYNLSQSGMGLGERDYYYAPQYDLIRIEYKKYLANLFELIGYSKNESYDNAKIVFEFEKIIAGKAFTRLEMRDVEKMYNVYTPATLKQLASSIDWDSYFKQKNIKQPDTIIVAMVDYLKNVSSVINTTPIETLKLYAKAQLIMDAAPYLSSAFETVHFDFRGKIISGAKQMKPRWQRTQSTMDRVIGDIVSEEFVKKHFTPKAKAKVNSLIDNLVLAYRDRIASRDWMEAETKKQANKKLDLLIRKVGYPEKWKNYSKLQITTDNYWANYNRGIKNAVIENLEELSKPVDRYKWQMTPVTVNAYYDPTTNEITFPAAILQPPFFDADAEDAANYGTMGAIIGHELTHGFDDQGSQFDADGNMKMWWSKLDYDNFIGKTKGIVNQFNNYVAIDTLRVNGSMTQGENIADLGGLTMAYYAYKKSLKGKSSTNMGGYTGEQRFFIAWTQGWKTICRDAELKRLLTVDYHSPGYFRAFAPLTNLNEFYEAFNVKEGDKMYTPTSSRVEIW